MIEVLINIAPTLSANPWKIIGSEHRARHTYGHQYTYNRPRNTQDKYPINILTEEIYGNG